MMGTLFSIEKKPDSKLRKIPFLPRIGIYIDVAGYEIVFKKAPILEALFNLLEGGGLKMRNIKNISKQQLSEIQFPSFKKLRVVNTSARTISVETKSR